MDSANQIQALVDEVEKNPKYKISEQEAKGFLSEIKRLTKEDKTNMPHKDAGLHLCQSRLRQTN